VVTFYCTKLQVRFAHSYSFTSQNAALSHIDDWKAYDKNPLTLAIAFTLACIGREIVKGNEIKVLVEPNKRKAGTL
jgi:hypothetical protein